MNSQDIDRKPLEVQDIELWFPGGKAPALLGVNISLLPGTVTAIIGPAGVGKSTLFKAILNEIAISKGTVKVDGVEVINGKALDPRLYSYVPQKTNLMGSLTVWETLELAAYARLPKGRDSRERFRKVTEVIHQLNMDHKRDSFVRDLSGGEERRVSIGLELISSPRLLLLDEPTSGLDEGLDKELHETLRKVADGDRKPAVLFVTHSTTHLDMVDPDTGRPLVDSVIAIGKARKDSPTATVRYFGRPNDVLRNFGVSSYSGVMDILRSDPPNPRIIPDTKPDVSFKHAHKTLSGSRSIVYNLWRQWLLVGRAKGFAKTIFLRMLVGVGIALALLAVSTIGIGWNVGDLNHEFLTYTSTLVMLLAVASTALPVMGIVNSWDVIRREQRWGVSARSFVWAQMFIQVFQVIPSVAAATILSLSLTERPTSQTLLPQGGPFPEYWQLFLLLFLSTMAAYCLGVLIGTRNTSSYNANLATTIAFAVMLVGNGLIISWPTFAPVYYSSFLIPSRSGIALVASNFNAEMAMGVVSDDAFNLARDDFNLLMVFVAAASLAFLLFAIYSVRYSLGKVSSGASKVAAVTGQNSSQAASVGSAGPQFSKPIAATLVMGLLLIVVVGQYFRLGASDANADPKEVAAQPTATHGPSFGSQPTSTDAVIQPQSTDDIQEASMPTEKPSEPQSQPPIIGTDETTADSDEATDEASDQVSDDTSDEADIADQVEKEAESEDTSQQLAVSALPENAAYIDIGGSNEPMAMRGLSATTDDLTDMGEAWSCTLGGFTDYTKRDQLVQSTAGAWVVVPVQVNSQERAIVTFCIEEDESGTDYWELWLGGDRPEDTACTEVLITKPADLTAGLNTVSVEIPAECIPSGNILLVFTSQANDGAGIWGLLVEQESAIANTAPEVAEETVAVDASTTTLEESDVALEAEASEEVSDTAGTDEIAEGEGQPAIEPVGEIAEEEPAENQTEELNASDNDAIESNQDDDATEEMAAADDVIASDAQEEESAEDVAGVEEAVTEEATEAPTEEAPVDPMPIGATYVDIGGNDEPDDLNGFSQDTDDLNEMGDAWSCKLGGYRDYTRRDQVKPERDEDLVTVSLPVNRLQQTTVSFCIEENEDRSDTWTLQLAGDRPSDFGCDTMHLTKPTHLNPGINTVSWTIPPECIPGDEVVLEFIDQKHDGMGIWGILIEQDPLITADPPSEAGAEFCVGYSPEGRCYSEGMTYTQAEVDTNGLPAHEWDHCWVEEHPDPADTIHTCVIWAD